MSKTTTTKKAKRITKKHIQAVKSAPSKAEQDELLEKLFADAPDDDSSPDDDAADMDDSDSPVSRAA
jgi:hypothetical protein